MNRSSYKYWTDRPKALSPDRIRLLTEVRSVHKESNGSAGARTVATIVTNRGTPLSRYRAGRRWAYLAVVLAITVKQDHINITVA